MKVLVGNFTDTQFFMQVEDSLAIKKKNPQYCGARSYELTLQYDFLSIIVPSNPWGGESYSINLRTSNFKMVGNYLVTLKTSLLLFTMVPPLLS
jgi:hypothetical protein